MIFCGIVKCAKLGVASGDKDRERTISMIITICEYGENMKNNYVA